MTDLELVLVLLVLFQIKHFVADYPLQTPEMIRGKGILFNPQGILHSLHHSGLTLVTLGIFALVHPIAIIPAVLISVSEFFVHYVIDYSKMQYGKSLTTNDSRFWWAIGFDQMLHHLTYLAFAWIVLT